MMDEKMYCVYMHRNKTNGKVYIGQTNQKAEHRWGKDGHGYSYQKLFARAIRKYGWNGFEHIIVSEHLTHNEADSIEKELIRKYDSQNPSKGYNIESGGSDGHLGFKHSDDAKEKIRMHGILNPPSIECTIKGNKARMKQVCEYDLDGKLLFVYNSVSEASRKYGITPCAITNACKGKVKQSCGKVWRFTGDAFDKFDTIQRCNEERKTVVEQVNLDGTVFFVYESQSEASRRTGISQGNIGCCCRGERETAGGFRWRFAEVVT